MRDDAGHEPTPPEEISNAPQHTEHCGGHHNPDAGDQSVNGVSQVSKAKRNARKNDLCGFAIPSVSELGHEERAKEHLFTESSRDSQGKRRHQMESLWRKRV